MKIAITRAGSGLMISLRGDLTESSEDALIEVLQKIENLPVSIDTEKVELINSIGARVWINFIQALMKRSPQIKFLRCSDVFIDSCNIYPKFVPPNSIDSLFLPVQCDSCGDLNSRLLERHEFLSDDPLAGVSCDKCGKNISSAVDLEEFFYSVRS